MTIFAGQDLNNYSGWEKVTTPSGNVYYAVPGTGYIYDPVLSAAKGKAILFVNPTAKKKEQEKAAKELKEMQSPLNQAIPVVAGTAGTVGSMYAVNALGPTTAAEKLAEAALAKETAAQAAAQGAGVAPTVLSVDPVTGAATQGAAPGIGITPYLGAAGAALGGFGVHKAIESNNPLAGGISGASAGLGLGMAAPLVGMGPLGWGALGLMALGGAGLGGGLTAALGKPSTKEIQAGRWKDVGHAEMAGNANRDYFAGTGGEESRDESKLTADAIRVNPDNFNAAADYDKWSKPAQDEFLNSLLSAGKVSERKGGIYYDDDFAKAEADRVREKYKVQDMGKQLADKKNARK